MGMAGLVLFSEVAKRNNNVEKKRKEQNDYLEQAETSKIAQMAE